MWKTIQRPLKSILKDSLAVIGLSQGLDLKEVVRNLQFQTRWILEPNCRDRSSGISWYQCLGEMRFKKLRKWKEVNTLQGSTKNIELLLQMVISVNQLSICGSAADMIEELPVCQKAPGRPAAPGQLDKREILKQPPLAENASQ